MHMGTDPPNPHDIPIQADYVSSLDYLVPHPQNSTFLFFPFAKLARRTRAYTYISEHPLIGELHTHSFPWILDRTIPCHSLLWID